MRLKLSKDEALYLRYLVATSSQTTPEEFLQETIRSFIEGENGFCLDPKRSEFRAWLVKRDPRTPTTRCLYWKRNGKGKGGGPACPPCAAYLAEIKAEVARDAEAVA